MTEGQLEQIKFERNSFPYVPEKPVASDMAGSRNSNNAIGAKLTLSTPPPAFLCNVFISGQVLLLWWQDGVQQLQVCISASSNPRSKWLFSANFNSKVTDLVHVEIGKIFSLHGINNYMTGVHVCSYKAVISNDRRFSVSYYVEIFIIICMYIIKIIICKVCD